MIATGLSTTQAVTAANANYQARRAAGVAASPAPRPTDPAAPKGDTPQDNSRFAPRSISSLKIPSGLTEEQFEKMKSTLRASIAQQGYVGNLVVQGSRASGGAIKPSTNLDLALRVEPMEFDRILNERSKLANPNPGSSKERSRTMAIAEGRIFAGEARLSSSAEEIKRALGVTVQFSIAKIGGKFDNGPQISISENSNEQ